MHYIFLTLSMGIWNTNLVGKYINKPRLGSQNRLLMLSKALVNVRIHVMCEIEKHTRKSHVMVVYGWGTELPIPAKKVPHL